MKKRVIFSANTFGKLLSVLLGLMVIVVLSSILAHLQVVIYPRASMSMYRRTDLTGLDIINFIIRVMYVCLSCTIGGMLTALIGRSRVLNIIVGIIMTIFLTCAALKLGVFHPIWFWIVLIIFITPSVLLGYKIVKKRVR